MSTLSGRVVLVTRAAGRAAELSVLLRARGARAIEAPAISVEPVGAGGPLDEAVARAASGAYAWVVFTSGAGVEAWFERAEALETGMPEAKVAAVGDGTAEALRRRRIEADLVPPTFTTEALGDAFPDGQGEVAMPRADIATGTLEETLRSKGWTPVRIDAYRTRPAETLPEPARRALEAGDVDAVTFTSASTVEGFVGVAGPVRGPAVVCIGPVTADAARRAGLRVDEVADPHTIGGLVDAVERAMARARGGTDG